MTVGSSPQTSSPTSADSIASLIVRQGFVIVSLRKSTTIALKKKNHSIKPVLFSFRFLNNIFTYILMGSYSIFDDRSMIVHYSIRRHDFP